MAITRAQIARELYIKGGVVNPDGRRGFFKGAEQDSKDKGTNISPGTVGAGPNRGKVRDDNPFTGPTVPIKKPKETKLNKIKRTVSQTGPFSYLDKVNNSKLTRINNAKQRQNYIRSLDLTDPEERQEYLDIMQQLGPSGMDIIAKPTELDSTMLSVPPSMLATNPMTEFGEVDNVSKLGNPGVDDVLGEGYEDYLNRNKTKVIDGDDNPVEQDPCKGPNPPAYCFIGDKADETIEAQRNLGGLAPLFGGSIYDSTGLADGGRAGLAEGGMPYEGGIMDLETGRQMYFFGKLVKKATRAVKKIVKSPVGKAALLYFGGNALMSGGLGEFLKIKAAPFLFNKSGGTFAEMLKGGLTGKGKFALAAGLTAAPLLMGQQEEEDEPIDLGPSLPAPLAEIRNRPFDFLSASTGGSKFKFAANGGLMRTAYAEGSKEPVAKETMPLIDMDGQEMDLREDGGFVPIGRMEKADDVPARLSKNEFVFTADAVRNAGEGDIDKGAEVMYNMMKNLESGGEVSEESQGLDGAREMFKTSQRLEEVL